MREEKGQDLVEFALIAPVLFLLLFGILEFGVAVWRYNTIANAAREGARAAINYDTADRDESARVAACVYMNGLGIPCDPATLGTSSNPQIEVTRVPFEIGTGITRSMVAVAVTFQYDGVTGLAQLISSGGITLRASSSMLPEGTE